MKAVKPLKRDWIFTGLFGGCGAAMFLSGLVAVMTGNCVGLIALVPGIVFLIVAIASGTYR